MSTRDRESNSIPNQPSSIRDVLARCSAGKLAPNVALMHLTLLLPDADSVQKAIDHGLMNQPFSQANPLVRMLDLFSQARNSWSRLKAIISMAEHDRSPDNAIAYWASVFDKAVILSPEAGVALYSLGRSDLLDASTDEIMTLIDTWIPLSDDYAVLEIGCGIGRCLDRLASSVRIAIGTDISEGMARLARARCAGHDNVTVIRSAGRDLSALRDHAFNLVLAVDSFPYLHSAGLIEPHFRDVARVLKLGGHFLLLNFSYSGDDAGDRAQVTRLAGANQFEVLRNGERPFQLWDGLAFHLRLYDVTTPEV